jgi:hypothetical protein
MSSMDTTTWFDQRPSHEARPSSLVLLKQQVDQAYEDATAYLEKHNGTAGELFDIGEYRAMMNKADDLADQYRTAWTGWEAFEYPAVPTVCTCPVPENMRNCAQCTERQFPF